MLCTAKLIVMRENKEGKDNLQEEMNFFPFWAGNATFFIWIPILVLIYTGFPEKLAFFAVWLFIAAIVNAYFLVPYLLKMYAVKEWKKVQGTCHSVGIRKIMMLGESRGGPVERYRPYCSYRYEVDGVRYSSSRLSLIDKDFAYAKEHLINAERLIKKDSRAKTVTVYVNPDNPADAMLVPRISLGKTITLKYILLLVVLAIAVGVFFVILLYV